MAFDALSLSQLAKEFDCMLVGGKITKVYQPEKDEIVLFVFNKQTYKLVLSANAGVNRIHVTNYPTDNPKVAPSFCMLLRKFVTNATITNVYQMPYERVLDFSLQVVDELGYKTQMHLIFELTGKTSNIILTNDNYVICDSIKHLPQDLDSQRIIMAGAKYNFFAPQNKLLVTDTNKIRSFLNNCKLPLRQALCDNLLGVSQTTVNEILCGIDENDHTIVNNDKVITRLNNYLRLLQDCKPCVVMQNGMPVEVCPFDYQSKSEQKVFFDTLNQAHDNYYYLLDKTQRFKDKSKSVATVVKNAISRTEKKLAIQRQSILDSKQMDVYKNYGDVILSNLWQIGKQQSVLSVVDYTTNEMLNIELDAQLTPQQNAQAYYKKYRKLKSAMEHNTLLVQENTQLLNYLQTIRQSLNFCNEIDDLEQIRQELFALGLIKEQKQHKGKDEKAITPLKYNVHGYVVYVGKNNVQNNYVTHKLAKSNDIWLHTQTVHSSHVLIVANGKDVPNEVIVGAGEICAYYSQASAGTKIPVDYTTKNHVKKPNKAPLGFVVYDNYQTILVNPNRHVEWVES